MGVLLVETSTPVYYGHSAWTMCDVKCTWNSEDALPQMQLVLL